MSLAKSKSSAGQGDACRPGCFSRGNRAALGRGAQVGRERKGRSAHALGSLRIVQNHGWWSFFFERRGQAFFLRIS